jgi:aspartate kinase
MALVVQKYGGTSVGDLDRIRHVADRVARERGHGNDLVVVVSAMAGETNRLLALARQGAETPTDPESDVLAATGEQVTASLLALVLQDRGVPARSFLGFQVPIVTDDAFGRARIREIRPTALRAALAAGEVAVVAGFQGVTQDGRVATLGRGGSDTTAVAVDPRIVPGARKLSRIAHDEMLELASLGAKVLHIRSVEYAKRYAVPLHVRSSFNEDQGTWVVREERGMEEVSVAGVACDRDQAKLTVVGVPDRPGVAARVFGPVAAAGIVVDMIIQNASADGTTDLTFTVPQADYERARRILEDVGPTIGATDIRGDLDLAKVSIVGLGMRTHAGIAARMFEVLAAEGINVQMISTSEIKISVVVAAKYAELAVRALHDAFITGP